MTTTRLQRAQGCLLGQIAGDSLGSLVEFSTPERLRQKWPDGLRELADGGVWMTIAGQPTDDSEMALALARSLARQGIFDLDDVRVSYQRWIRSEPFDSGHTTRQGLAGNPLEDSQANGALMRISPLGIFGAGRDPSLLSEWAGADAAITHPHPICREISSLYAQAIAEAVEQGSSAERIYGLFVQRAREQGCQPEVIDTIQKAADGPPDDFMHQMGWVLIAFQNALWQLLHAEDLESGVVDTVMRGGDTDTNGAIAGALLGAVYGEAAIPKQWRDCILRCEPGPDHPRAYSVSMRPEEYWPSDCLVLAEQLLAREVR